MKFFEKYAKIMHFKEYSYENLRKVSQNFPTHSVFRPNARKTNAWFIKFFENMLKECVFSNYPKKIFETFLKISHNLHFLPNERKTNAKFVESFDKYAKIMHFS